MLIDVTNSENRNGTKKETKNILKYKTLITEIQLMWNVKAKVMPVIIRATGRISKSPEQHKRKTRNKGTTKKQPYSALHTYFEKC